MQILTRHLLPTTMPAASLTDATQVTTAGENDLDVSVGDGIVTFSTADGTVGTVTTADLETCSSFVHIIDSVLLLPEDVVASDLDAQSVVLDVDAQPVAPGEAVTGQSVAPEPAVLNPGVVPVTPGPAGPVLPENGPAGPFSGPAALAPHVDGVTGGPDGTYSVCSGRWAPEEFSGPEPCGIRVRSTGVINIGSQFGGSQGFFSEDAGDGQDEDTCFKASLAAMFGQKLCNFSRLDGGIQCQEQLDGSLCICLAPFGQPDLKLPNNRKWRGNIEFNTFLKILQSRSEIDAATDSAGVAGNKVMVERTLMDMLTVTDCA